MKAISNYSSINFSNFAYFEKCILEFTSELFDVLFTFPASVKEITTQPPMTEITTMTLEIFGCKEVANGSKSVSEHLRTYPSPNSKNSQPITS